MKPDLFKDVVPVGVVRINFRKEMCMVRICFRMRKVQRNNTHSESKKHTTRCRISFRKLQLRTSIILVIFICFRNTRHYRFLQKLPTFTL